MFLHFILELGSLLVANTLNEDSVLKEGSELFFSELFGFYAASRIRICSTA